MYILYMYIQYTNASPQPEMTQIESFQDSLNPKVGSFRDIAMRCAGHV